MKTIFKGMLLLLILAVLVSMGIGTQPTNKGLAATPAYAANTPQKVVPIISVGKGVRVGGALVTGSASKVDQVKAVAQVEGSFSKSVRVRILVPVSSENVVQKISRVPGTSVTGLVDIKI